MKISLATAVVFAASSLITACGGGTGSGVDNSANAASGSPQFSVPTDEITADNALQALSVADRAISRFMTYYYLNNLLTSQVVSLAPSFPTTATCQIRAALTDLGSGQVTTQALSANSVLIKPLKCTNAAGDMVDSGLLQFDSIKRVTGTAGTASSHSTSLREVKVASGDDAAVVNGNINYAFDWTNATATSGAVWKYNYSGLIDYIRNAKVDQYRNIGLALTVTTSFVDGKSTANMALDITSLEITSPRALKSAMKVRTVKPISVATDNFKGIVEINSTKDASRAQMEVNADGSVRILAWNSKGDSILDVIKQSGDKDLIAAENATLN